jgi:hypothetical protein
MNGMMARRSFQRKSPYRPLRPTEPKAARSNRALPIIEDIRIFVDVNVSPAQVVTVYRASKIDKYWSKQ